MTHAIVKTTNDMKRKTIPIRPDWKERCEAVGFMYHSLDNYWREGTCYVFSYDEIEVIERATAELHQMCMDFIDEVIEHGKYEPFGLSPVACQLVEESWRDDQAHLYGRFDLAFDGKHVKLLEYNADTPTALLESSVVQWDWLQDHKFNDQFNSLHERLIERWQVVREDFPLTLPRLYFAALRVESPEDECQIAYMADTALQAGFKDVSTISIEEIGLSEKQFVDVKGEPILACFKLYPWEFMMADNFGQWVAGSSTTFVEPPWKMLLSNKVILDLLWQEHQGHPYLLEAHSADKGFTPIGEWVYKPTLAREGENAKVVKDGIIVVQPPKFNPEYDKRYVWQSYFEVPRFDGFTPIIGSWVIGDNPAGMGIREDPGVITHNKSFFVPHYIEK